MIKSLGLEVDHRPDVTIDLTTPGSVEKLKGQPFTIKEGAAFRMKATFVVQHDVLSGLKYLQVVKRKGIRVGKSEEMIVGFFVFFSLDCFLLGVCFWKIGFSGGKGVRMGWRGNPIV